VAKATSRYVCQHCGEAFLRWEGQCRACGEWNSLVETLVRTKPASSASARVAVGGDPVALRDIGEASVPRLPTSIGELDRVLGGGIVHGSLILVGGEPGIGKSTLLLQAAAGVGARVIYATGEESAAQVRLRAERLGLLDAPAGSSIEVLAERDVGRIVEVARAARPALLVVDSIQTATIDELDGAAGSVGQVRESTVRFMGFAKGEGIAVVLVGHVTKEGSIAGPKTMEHLVDAVVTLEGERFAALRLVRSTKNRFDRRGGGLRDGRRRAARGRRSGARVPRRSPRSGAGQRGRPDDGGQPALARRGPGAGLGGRLRHARSQGQWYRPEPARTAGRGPWPPRQDRAVRS
jgi:DNA repair protein RadA/Sms